MICSRCAQNVPEGAPFCPTCGQQVVPATSASAGPSLQAPQAPSSLTSPPGPQKTSGLAIASLISGLFLFFFPLSILAVVFGHISLSQIKKSAGRLGGRTLAIVGLVLGYFGIAIIPLILIIAAIAIPNLLRARMAANGASAVSAIRTIYAAQVSYRSMYPDVGYAADLQSLGGDVPCTSSPATACLIESSLAFAGAAPGKNGYVFAVTRSDNGTEFLVSAEPATRNQTGIRSFCSTEDGVVRVDPIGGAIADREACAALAPISK